MQRQRPGPPHGSAQPGPPPNPRLEDEEDVSPARPPRACETDAKEASGALPEPSAASAGITLPVWAMRACEPPPDTPGRANTTFSQEWPTPSLDSRAVPAVVLLALAAINVRGYWSILTSPGCTVGDDNSSHFAEASAFAARIRNGDLDLWFSEVQLGYPLFMTYTPLPLLILGPFLALAPDIDTEFFVYKCFALLLWVGSPVAWYVGARRMGLSRLQASCTAILWNRTADNNSFGVGINALLAKGLLSHSVACLLLPLWLGSAFQRISQLSQQHPQGGGWAASGLLSWLLPSPSPQDAACAVIFSAVLMSNSFSAIFGLLAAAAMLAADLPRPRALLRGSLWLCCVVLVAALANAFWLLRFLTHIRYQGGLPFKHWPNFRGQEVAKQAKWVLSGDVLDFLAAPVCTLLFLAGLFGARGETQAAGAPVHSASTKREDALSIRSGMEGPDIALHYARTAHSAAVLAWGRLCGALDSMTAPARTLTALRVLFLMSTFMLLGRENAPLVYGLLPFHNDVEAIRYCIGVQASALLLGGVAASACVQSVWGALCALSAAPFYRLTAFLTLAFLLCVVVGGWIDGRVQALPYAKVKSWDIHKKGYSNVSEYLRNWKETPSWHEDLEIVAGGAANAHDWSSSGGIGGRYLVHKTGSTHFVLNMLAHVSGVPGAISYSRGYHDTLSFWFLEHFAWSEEMFRLYNIRHVVVAKKNITSVPAYFETSYPRCPKGMPLSECTTHHGDGFSVHSTVRPYGYFELVSSPLVVCTEQVGLKDPATRHLLLDMALPMYQRGLVPSVCGAHSCEACLAARKGPRLSSLKVLGTNTQHVMREALKGPQVLRHAVLNYSAYALEVPGRYRLNGNLAHVTKQLQDAMEAGLEQFSHPKSRSACRVGAEARVGEVYSARVQCAKGHTVSPADVLLFKMSFHPLWRAAVRSEGGGMGGGGELPILHLGPNLIGVPLSPLAGRLQGGEALRIEMFFRSPRDQHLLLAMSFILVGMLCGIAMGCLAEDGRGARGDEASGRRTGKRD